MSWDEGAQCVGGSIVFSSRETSNWSVLHFVSFPVKASKKLQRLFRTKGSVREKSDAIFVSALDFLGRSC